MNGHVRPRQSQFPASEATIPPAAGVPSRGSPLRAPPPNRSRPTQFQVWDLGGQTSIRPYWRCYYPNTDAIIFVVDSADVERMPVARGELAAMLEEDELRDAILLVFANKQDQKGALHAQQISDALGLPEVRNRQWSIQETSALQGKGLFEGFDWLVSCIKGAEGE